VVRLSPTRPAPALALLLVTAAGCGGGGRPGTTATSPPRTSATGLEQPEARVEFTAPQDGAATASTVTARVRVTGVRLAPKAMGEAARAGEGHLHFSLDGGRYDRPEYSGANGRLAQRLGVQGRYSPATAPTITYTNLPPGEHTLEVRVANNDHTNTRAAAEVTFTVQG
jgi:hypothetical protein